MLQIVNLSSKESMLRGRGLTLPLKGAGKPLTCSADLWKTALQTKDLSFCYVRIAKVGLVASVSIKAAPFIALGIGSFWD